MRFAQIQKHRPILVSIRQTDIAALIPGKLVLRVTSFQAMYLDQLTNKPNRVCNQHRWQRS